jgi:hypothetical protein
MKTISMRGHFDGTFLPYNYSTSMTMSFILLANCQQWGFGGLRPPKKEIMWGRRSRPPTPTMGAVTNERAVREFASSIRYVDDVCPTYLRQH